ncbi:cyclic 3',5'-adenosine monophosphate phosphodiesterase [Atlantibacter hermannii]|nr:cyclic 3',5'-adenosine monophosphate phosphodiesterase [Atlantibacter hermannii]
MADACWRRLLPASSSNPICANFTIDTIAPGWRWLELHPDGTLTTEVERLEGTQFNPDTASEGY